MDLLFPIATMLGGLIASSAFIATRQPNAASALQTLVPFQGGIGVLMLAWGGYGCGACCRT